MAWGPIDEPETDPFAPLKSSLFKRLVNNLVAAFNGDAGAPALARAALRQPTSGTAVTISSKTILTTVSSDRTVEEYVSLSSGAVRVFMQTDAQITARFQELALNSSSWSDLFTITPQSSGAQNVSVSRHAMYRIRIENTDSVSGGGVTFTIQTGNDAITFFPVGSFRPPES